MFNDDYISQTELKVLYEALKEKCPIKYKDKDYYCGKCSKCKKENQDDYKTIN